MINKTEQLFYIKNEETPLFLPMDNIVQEKEWIVCAIKDDCDCLDIYDVKCEIEKSIEYYNSSPYYFSYFFAFDLNEIIATKIENIGNQVYTDVKKSIDTLLKDDYYESYAITDENENFLILHSHADNITFICGSDDFLTFQFDGKNAKEFMHNYHRCIKSKYDFCRAFSWHRLGIDSDRYL